MDSTEGFMLCCEHMCNGRDMVPGGLAVLHEEDIMMILSMNEDVRAVKKAIEPKKTTVDIYKSDLLTEEEKKALPKKKKASGDSSEVPWKLFLGHSMEGHAYTEVMIFVPEVVAKGGKEKKNE